MHTIRFSLTLLFISLLFSMGPLEAVAQFPEETLTGPTVKEYGRAGYPKVTVFVWGTADTGVWKVEEGTDLLEFLSVAARSEGTNRNVEIRNYQYLKMYREDQDRSNDPFFESRMDELFAREKEYPQIQEGDILLIESRAKRRFTWRDISQVTGTLASLVSTYLLLNRLSE